MKKDLTKHTRSAWKRPVWWKYIVAFFIILINALPLYVLIEMSLKQSTDLASRLTWPDYIYLGNYLKILKNAGQSNLLNAFKNTILVTACVVGIEVFCGCLAAYPLARLQHPLGTDLGYGRIRPAAFHLSLYKLYYSDPPRTG